MNTHPTRPLVGKTIVVTRPLTQAHELADQLDQLGAAVHEFATIDIQLRSAELPGDFEAFDWVVFTSGNAVRGLRAAMSSEGFPFRFPNAKICAVGPSTRRELTVSGMQCDLVPETYTADSAFEALRDTESLAGKRVLLPQGNIARQDLAESLVEAGAEVERVVVYETLKPAHEEVAIRALIEADPDWVTFTSASTAKNFSDVVNADQLPNTKFASIGPQTTAAVEDSGLPIAVEAEEHTIPGLIDAIVSHYS